MVLRLQGKRFWFKPNSCLYEILVFDGVFISRTKIESFFKYVFILVQTCHRKAHVNVKQAQQTNIVNWIELVI